MKLKLDSSDSNNSNFENARKCNFLSLPVKTEESKRKIERNTGKLYVPHSHFICTNTVLQHSHSNRKINAMKSILKSNDLTHRGQW